MTPAKTPLVTILAGAALAAAQPATAQTTIFSDSFDRETGLLEIPAFGGVSDWGQTDNAAGGIASPNDNR